MKNKNKNVKEKAGYILIAFGVVMLIVVGFFVLNGTAKAQIVNLLPDRILDLFDRHVELERADAIGEVEEELNLGAFPGSSFFIADMNFNGLRKTTGKGFWMLPASTTLSSMQACIVLGPKTASSTLVFAGLRSVSSNLTSGDYKIYRATTTPTFENVATSSGQLLGDGFFADGVFEEFYATSSILESPTLSLFGPGDVLIWDFSLATSSIGLHQKNSYCVAEWNY